MEPVYFPDPAAFRAWLEAHHETQTQLWVGYWKKGTGRPTLTWPESVDEALCFGWIDGLRKTVDADRYQIRFTPRKPGSNWSTVNLGRMKALVDEGRMRPAGQRIFEARDPAREGVYSFERRCDTLDEPYATLLKANDAASAFFEKQPGSYRRAAINWILSAQQEATRLRRLEALLADSAAGRTLPQFTRAK